MSLYTNFLKLLKPDTTDKYNINVFNDNADLIDSEFSRLHIKNESQDNLLATKASLDTHISDNDNPHRITKAQIGLNNVENKSSAEIRNEITKANVTEALGYTPYTPSEIDSNLSELGNNITVLHKDTINQINSISAIVNSGYRLVLQPDGNLVLYNKNGVAIWHTGTSGR